jgi:hypothetical protein
MFLLTGLIVLSLIPCIKVSGIPPMPMNISGYVFIQKTGGPKTTAPTGLNVTARQHTTILYTLQGSTLTNAQGYYMIAVSGVANGTLIDLWVQSINVTRITFIQGGVIDQTDGGNLTVIDTVPPSIQIVSPPQGGKVPINQPAWINATVTDNLAINASTIKMTLNQTQLTTVFNPTTGLLSNKTWPLARGLYMASINVRDIAGNAAPPATWNFTATSVLSVTISPTSVTMDAGQSQTFNATATAGTPPYTYKWYLNGTAVSGATNKTWTFKPTSAGSYSVYVIANDTAGVKGTSNTATVTVNPALSVTISPTSVTLDIGQNQTFTSTVSGGTKPYTYKWYLNGTAVSGATNSTWMFKPSSVGNYNVSIKVDDAVSSAAVPVKVGSVTVVPEFPTIIVLILMLSIVSALILALDKRRKPIRS